MSDLSESLTFPRGATISNRFVQPPMLTNSGKDGEATQDTINYYKAHAKSGGMVITEYMYVSENGGPAMTWDHDHTQLAVYDDKFVPQLKKVAAAIKSSGNKAIMQIAHTGREANFRAMEGKPVYAPSTMDYPFLKYRVHGLSDEQVRDIVADFGKAVKRAVDAGFDGIEIHGANHYLIQQFFSAYSNRRTDHWGGSLEKRMNFPLAVVESVMNAVKEYAPDDFIVGYRISPEEIHGKNIGYTWEDAVKLVNEITKRFKLDYIHLSMKQYDAKPGAAMLGDIGEADSSFKNSDKTLAELFKPALNGAKEIIVGDINNRQKAEAARKLADLVAVGRENIVDPLFAEKILNNEDDKIVTELSVEQVKVNKMTQGLIANFSVPDCPMHIDGMENITSLHKGFGCWSEMKYPKNSEVKD